MTLYRGHAVSMPLVSCLTHKIHLLTGLKGAYFAFYFSRSGFCCMVLLRGIEENDTCYIYPFILSSEPMTFANTIPIELQELVVSVV